MKHPECLSIGDQLNKLIRPPPEHCAAVRESKESSKGAQGVTTSHCQIKSSQACDAHGKLPLGRKEGDIKRCSCCSVRIDRVTSLERYTKGEENGGFLSRADDTGWSETPQCVSYNVIIFESREGDTRSEQTSKRRVAAPCLEKPNLEAWSRAQESIQVSSRSGESHARCPWTELRETWV